MGQSITCYRCRGVVGIPEPLTRSVTCPFCKAFLVAFDPVTKATWRPKQPTPLWIIRLAVIAGFVGYFYFIRWMMGPGVPWLDVMVFPLFSVPVLAALYWVVTLQTNQDGSRITTKGAGG
jgi:hypothetical protein